MHVVILAQDKLFVRDLIKLLWNLAKFKSRAQSLT